MKIAARVMAGGRPALFLYCAASICGLPGCLTLGGRTTYMQASPEIEARVKGLETRVGALERAMSVQSTTLPPYSAGAEEIISRSPSAASEH